MGVKNKFVAKVRGFEMNGLEPSDLPVIMCINEPFFRKNSNPDLEWATHLPMKVCSLNLVLSPKRRDSTESDFNREAQSLFSFATTILANKPPASKKCKAEEVASGEGDEVDTGVAPEDEIFTQVPLPLPEPEELPVPRLTRSRRVDKA